MEEKNKIKLHDSSPKDENVDILDEKHDSKEEPKKAKKHSQVLGTFLFSLLAAIVLWIVAVDYEVTDYEKEFTNIEVIMNGKTELLSSKGLQVEFDNRFNLDVKVSGKRSLLSKLKASDFKGYIDVSAITEEGIATLKVDVKPVNGVTIVEQSVAEVTVLAEKRVTKDFDIIPMMGAVQLDNGVEYSLEASEKSVCVTGSESILKNIDSVVVYVNPEPKNVKTSFSSNCKIVFLGVDKKEIDMSEFTVEHEYCEVTVKLRKEKKVPVVIDVTGGYGIDYGTSLSVSEINGISIIGEPELIDETENISLTVPYEKISNRLQSNGEPFSVSGTLEFPEGVAAVNGITEMDVKVSPVTEEIVIPGNGVNVLGQPDGYNAEIKDVIIKLTGLKEEISKIERDGNITVQIDLSKVHPTNDEHKVLGIVKINDNMSVLCETQCYVFVKFISARTL